MYCVIQTQIRHLRPHRPERPKNFEDAQSTFLFWFQEYNKDVGEGREYQHAISQVPRTPAIRILSKDKPQCNDLVLKKQPALYNLC